MSHVPLSSAQGVAVIGVFAFTAHPASSLVVVELSWGANAERQGTIVVSEGMARAMEAAEYEPVGEPLSVPAALSYAVFLAMKARSTLMISGDPSVWDPAWGELRYVWRDADLPLALSESGDRSPSGPDATNVHFLGDYLGVTRWRSDA